MKKIHVVPQFQQTECGLCVITMILNYYGAYYSLNDIRKKLTVGRDGLSIKLMIDTLEGYNVNARAYKASVKELSNCQFPFIITWEEKHYVIVERIAKGKYHVVDSGIGRVRYTEDEFMQKYSGIVIIPQKKEGFKKVRPEYKIWTILNKMFLQYKRKIAAVMMLTMISYLITFIIPTKIQSIIDRMDNKISGFEIITLLLWIFVYAIISYVRRRELSLTGINLERDVNKNVFTSLLKKPYRYFENRTNSEIIFCLNNTSEVRNIYINYLLNIIFDFGTMVIVSVYFVICNINIFLCLFFIGLVNILLAVISQPIMIYNNRMLVKEKSDLMGLQVDMIYSIRHIKTTCAEEDVLNNWEKKYNVLFGKSVVFEKISNLFSSFLAAVEMLAPIVLLIISLFFVSRREISVGMAMALYTMSNMFFNSLYSFLNTIGAIIGKGVYVSRLQDILLDSECDTNLNGFIPDVKGNLKIDNGYFRYSKDGQYVLKNISLDIPQYSSVAIIGKSGSGKSTLMKVIAGLYDLEQGRMYVDGHDISYLNKENYRKQLGFVEQDTWLQNKSILDNITMGKPDISIDRVYEACRLTNIHEDIMKMPMKYNTLISDLGANISGGQQQRIILARLILHDAKIILLDEATSALDYVNENKILDYIKNKKCTKIIVTHNINTIRNADIIIVMDDGEIVESGKYDILKNRKFSYLTEKKEDGAIRMGYE